MMEGGEDIGAPFVADGEAAETGKPGECPLDHPSVSAKALAALNATPGDAWNDPPPA
ncbi:hypothetical protein GCM10007856_60030 [Azospirillum oryzae]|nr:hypothetical protein GCM10007856_60030 [Azospirillum oryzae]